MPSARILQEPRSPWTEAECALVLVGFLLEEGISTSLHFRKYKL